jgi:CIC family chloride channel protein
VGAGAAGGIAAAFNAPIAGALFAVEIILMDFAFAQFSPIVIASVMATVISHHFEGNFAAFQVPLYQTSTPFELILYAVLGVLSGLFSFIFIKVLYFVEESVDGISFPEYLKPAVGGLMIGAIALGFPHIMGVGYDSINDALHGRLIGWFAFVLIFIKILATVVTLGSGGSGGIFAPSLFMGAMLGAFFGHTMDWLLPGMSLNPGAYALVAMGGMVAGTTRGSIMAIIMVFELTNDYRIILPLMITCIISTLLSSKLSSESIYTLKLLRRNINVKSGADQNVLRNIYIQDVMSKSFATIPFNANFKDVVNKLIKATIPYYFVVDKEKKLIGILSLQQIKNLLFERETLSHILIASELATREFPVIYPTDNAQLALEKMSKTTYECLPVMDPKKEGYMKGVVWRKDINDAYNKEIERLEISSNLASKISMRHSNKEVHFLEGYAVAEILAPKEFRGKSIRELNIRKNFSVDVLSIRTQHKNRSKVKAIPDPDHIITENDYLIVAGELGKLNRIRNME